MKTTLSFRFLVFSLFLGVLSSCSNEAIQVPGDTGAEAFMNQHTFKVASWEFYDHTSLDNFNLVQNEANIYLTFDDGTVYLCQIEDQGTSAERSVLGEFTASFSNGVFKGLWLDEFTFMQAVGLETRGEHVGTELYGEHELHQQPQSIFLKMDRLSDHPELIKSLIQ